MIRISSLAGALLAALTAACTPSADAARLVVLPPHFSPRIVWDADGSGS